MLKKIIVASLIFFTIFAAGNFINYANVSANSNIVYNEVDLQFQPLIRGSYFWGTVVNCNKCIYLHSAPFVSEERICKVPLGATVLIYKGILGMGHSCSPEGDFYYANYKGKWGWCLKQYIQIGQLINMRYVTGED